MDVIDTLSGIDAGSRLDELRSHRLEAREQAQATYDALFSPVDDSAMSPVERQAVAAFVAALFDVPSAEQYYGRLLADVDPAIAAAVTDAVELGRGAGPYGAFHGDLASESQPGRSCSSRRSSRMRSASGWSRLCCTPTCSRSIRGTRPEIACNPSSTRAGPPTASSRCPSS